MEKNVKEEVKILNELKNNVFRLRTLAALKIVIGKTILDNGHIAEIIMAFLLGRFASLIHDSSFVIVMESELDLDGIDFKVWHNHIARSVQLKWNKKNDQPYDWFIHVIELGASKEFDGKHYVPSEKGRYAFYRFLIESNAFSEEEVWTFDEEHPDFGKLCDEAWKIIKC